MSSFHIGELHAESDQKDQLLESLKILKEQVGFIDCTIYEADDDENKFITVEEWESKEDHQKFVSTFSDEDMQGWIGMQSEPPKSEFFTKR